MRLGRPPAQLFPRHHMQDFPAETLVAQQGTHLPEPGKAPVPIVLPQKRGRPQVQRGIEGVRVLVEARVPRPRGGAPFGRGDGESWSMLVHARRIWGKALISNAQNESGAHEGRRRKAALNRAQKSKKSL